MEAPPPAYASIEYLPPLYSESIAQQVVNDRVDEVSFDQLVRDGPLSFVDLITENISTSRMEQRERSVLKTIQKLLKEQGMRGDDLVKESKRRMVKHYLATESAARFQVADEYVEEAKDERPETLVAISMGNVEYIKNETDFNEYLARRIQEHKRKRDAGTIVPETEHSERFRNSIQEYARLSHYPVPKHKKERIVPPVVTSQEAEQIFSSVFHSDAGTFSKELIESATIVWEENKGVSEVKAAPSAGGIGDVWIPSLDMIPGRFRGVQACFDISVIPGSVPGKQPIPHPTNGEPMMPNGIRVHVGMSASYREIQLDRVMGSGSFGVVSAIRESALKSAIEASSVPFDRIKEIKARAALDSNFEPEQYLALKITLQNQRLLTPDDKAQDPRLSIKGAIGEYIIGQFVNMMFLEAHGPGRMAITPNVTRASFGFACRHLPPPYGQWKALYEKNKRDRAKRGPIQVLWDESTRTVKEWNPTKQTIVYAASEFADLGDLWSANKKTHGYLTKFEMIRSLLFQGLFTLSAFGEYGFIHQDIKPANMGLMSGGKNVRYLYYLDVGPSLEAFDPLSVQTRRLGNPKLLLKFLDYGNYDMAYNTDENGMKVFHYPGPRGTLTYTAPEGYILLPFANRKAGKYITASSSSKVYIEEPTFSVASDVWSFGMSIVALIHGDNPLHTIHPPPSHWKIHKVQLWREMAHILSYVPNYKSHEMKKLTRLMDSIRKGFRSELYNPKTEAQRRNVGHSVFTMLYDVTEMIGFPWSDTLQKDKTNKDMLNKFVKSGRYPLVEAMYNHKKAFVHARKGGWLWRQSSFRKALGVTPKNAAGLFLLLQMLSWDPEVRAKPYELLLYANRKKIFDSMHRTTNQVNRLMSDFEYIVDKYGWYSGTLVSESVRMVGGHMSQDNSRHTTCLGLTEEEDDIQVTHGLPTWKIGRMPIHIAAGIQDNPQLVELFGNVHPDDAHRLEKKNVDDEKGSTLHEWM